MNFYRWQKLMGSFGMSPNQTTYNALVLSYAEKHRHYHTSQHIDACFVHLDTVSHLAKKPNEIELALWFHDAVYKPYSSKNELNSALWAQQFLSENITDSLIIQRVYQLIMATLHDIQVNDSDQSLMVDIDLSILGSVPSVYQQFESNIRKEYKWVPSFIYRKKRKKILSQFDTQNSLYNNLFFIDLFEQQARANICQAISIL